MKQIIAVAGVKVGIGICFLLSYATTGFDLIYFIKDLALLKSYQFMILVNWFSNLYLILHYREECKRSVLENMAESYTRAYKNIKKKKFSLSTMFLEYVLRIIACKVEDVALS